MIKKGHTIKGSKVLVLGITFKEHTPDIRNSRVIDVINELKEFGIEVDVYDPWAEREEVKREYGFELIEKVKELEKYDGVVLTVAHKEFKELEEPIQKAKENSNLVVYDIKSFFDKKIVDGRL
jgi:UDP-N-acetyl-D-galactosamine dehydrogenase